MYYCTSFFVHSQETEARGGEANFEGKFKWGSGSGSKNSGLVQGQINPETLIFLVKDRQFEILKHEEII